MQKKTKIIIISTILLLIAIPIIILLIQNTNKPMPQNITEQAKATYATEIGTQTYDITNAVLEPKGIIPTISAGMIPIKWNGENFVITTRQDKQWYDYAKGQPAYIMLNDGYYKSELEVGIKEEQLMENNVGTNITRPEDLGTICMWIPSFAYNNQDEILYIKQAHSVAGTYTMPEIFTYETEKRDFSLAGIWVECKPLANTSEVNTKINKMNGKNNTYGFLANTIATNANNEPTYKATIETYINALSTDAGTDDQWSPLQMQEDNSINENNTVGAGLVSARTSEEYSNTVGASIARPQITDISNPNRTILKITNSNKLEPIKAKAYYDTAEEKIKIEVTYSTNAIAKILDKKGNILSENSTIADSGDEIIGNKVYKYMIIDNIGNIKEISTEVSGLDVYIIENEDDLKLFRDAVNANKTTEKTKAYQIADVKMNEGKYTINEETGDITFAEDAEKWTGITTSYYGKYYGNNHTISGMYGNKGLFDSCTGAEIRDLGIKESYIESSSSAIGAIVGYVQNNTILENCYNEATIKNCGSYVGGLVGKTWNNSSTEQLTIKNCYNKGKIISPSSAYIGGIVGGAYSIKISNCCNTASIIGNEKVGGIVGCMDYGISLLINCYNISDVVGEAYIGGIIGDGAFLESPLENCYNVGNISGTNNRVGGIAGCIREMKNSYNLGNVNGDHQVGGITGYMDLYTVRSSYNSGKVSGNSYVGGISGDKFVRASVLNCYYEENSALYGIGNSTLTTGSDSGATKLTQDQMPTVLSVINGDNAFVEDTEGINNGYPLLAWQVNTSN